jgi:malate dehydrogenase (oxaloacetate-decarboxylating)
MGHRVMFRTVTSEESGEQFLEVAVAGAAILKDSFLNKGEAFTREERDALGIRGFLPDHVSTMEEQLRRVEAQYGLKTTEIGKNVYLNGLMDRNETLFYRYLLDNLEELVPIIYTPTVALACSHWSRIYRRQHGLYVTPRDRGRIAEMLRMRPVSEPPVIVVTDNERILGIGDQGAGGMGIPIGKLALYTAAAGIHPERCIPVSLDVGTNNAELLDDPLYIGYREPRLRGAEYDSLVDEFVDAVIDVYPGALLQWEDFANTTSFRNLATHRKRIASFNDDIQGTAAMVVSGIITATRHLGLQSSDHRIVITGAGSAGHGIAEQIRFAMITDGMAASVARQKVFVLDSRGLLVSDASLRGIKAEMATDADVVAQWQGVAHPPNLIDVIRNVKPTVLIGVSGRAGLFTKEVVTEMSDHVDRPIILPLSNPTSHTEVTPSNALHWTDGRAFVATASPFSPVVLDAEEHRIGQANNVFVFPGMGLGVLAVEAREVTDGMFLEAARALSEATNRELVEQGQLYPDIDEVRSVSRVVAIAVAERAIAEGVANPVQNVEAAVRSQMWVPEYLPIRSA